MERALYDLKVRNRDVPREEFTKQLTSDIRQGINEELIPNLDNLKATPSDKQFLSSLLNLDPYNGKNPTEKKEQ